MMQQKKPLPRMRIYENFEQLRVPSSSIVCSLRGCGVIRLPYLTNWIFYIDVIVIASDVRPIRGEIPARSRNVCLAWCVYTPSLEANLAIGFYFFLSPVFFMLDKRIINKKKSVSLKEAALMF